MSGKSLKEIFLTATDKTSPTLKIKKLNKQRYQSSKSMLAGALREAPKYFIIQSLLRVLRYLIMRDVFDTREMKRKIVCCVCSSVSGLMPFCQQLTCF